MISEPLIIDTFIGEPGSGSATGICVIDSLTSDADLLATSIRIGLPVTAFIVQPPTERHCYSIRYFTPVTEIPACGHATLAAAKFLFDQSDTKLIRFRTIDQLVITTTKTNDLIWIEYPSYQLVDSVPGKEFLEAMEIDQYISAGYCRELESLFIELADAAVLRKVKPKYQQMMKLEPALKEVVLTSRSDDTRYDFLLRSFCPWIGIDEDPVTGSVHSVLAGFWHQRLGKSELTAYQASEASGVAYVRLLDQTVALGGKTSSLD